MNVWLFQPDAYPCITEPVLRLLDVQSEYNFTEGGDKHLIVGPFLWTPDGAHNPRMLLGQGRWVNSTSNIVFEISDAYRCEKANRTPPHFTTKTCEPIASITLTMDRTDVEQATPATLNLPPESTCERISSDEVPIPGFRWGPYSLPAVYEALRTD